MSKPPGEQNPAAAPATDPVAAEIEAEISDHLTTAAEQLRSQGLAADEAFRKSEKRFGDATAIGRRCYWIRQGDTLMFRTAVIVLLVVLCLALGAAAFSSWQTQRQMADQMVVLAEQLKTLAEHQKTTLLTPTPPADSQPLEIKGTVFVGAIDHPLAGTEVLICRVNDGEIVRRTATSGSGQFQSGPLTPGDYTVVADGVKDASWKGTIGIQTAPIYLYPGTPQKSLTIDAAYRSGRIGIKLSRPLPKLQVEGKYTIDSRLYVTATPSSSSLRESRWTVAEPAPLQWPVYIRNIEFPPPTQNSPPDYRSPRVSASVVLSNVDLAGSSAVEFPGGLNPLPAGSCDVQARVVADVLPAGRVDIDEMIWGSRSHRPTDADRQWMSNNWAANETLGQVWLLTLWKQRSPNRPYTSLPQLSHQYLGAGGPATEVLIADGTLTPLLVEIPEDVESRIAHLVETVTEPNQFREAVSNELPFVRNAKVSVLATGPMLPDGASAIGLSR
jgi:hypothetical protein